MNNDKKYSLTLNNNDFNGTKVILNHKSNKIAGVNNYLHLVNFKAASSFAVDLVKNVCLQVEN